MISGLLRSGPRLTQPGFLRPLSRSIRAMGVRSLCAMGLIFFLPLSCLSVFYLFAPLQGGASSSPAASGSRSSPSPSAPVTTTPPPPPPPSTTDATKPPSPPTQTQPPTPPTGAQTAGQGSSEGKSYGTVLITHPACIEHCIKGTTRQPIHRIEKEASATETHGLV